MLNPEDKKLSMTRYTDAIAVGDDDVDRSDGHTYCSVAHLPPTTYAMLATLCRALLKLLRAVGIYHSSPDSRATKLKFYGIYGRIIEFL